MNLDRKRPLPNEEKNILIHIITASVTLFVITSLISVILYIRHRIRQRKFKESDLEFLTNMTSIRDRLRQYSIDGNPLLELLASSKPGDLVQYPLDCVEYIRDLGQGQFGKVFQGMLMNFGQKPVQN